MEFWPRSAGRISRHGQIAVSEPARAGDVVTGAMVNRRTLLERAVQNAARFLPPHVVGAPFTFENPLQAFEDREFEAAVVEAAQIYGAQPFLSEDAYRQALAAGEFLPEDIEAVLAREPNKPISAGGLDRISLRRAMLACPPRRFDPNTIQWFMDETDLLLRFREGSILSHRANASSKGSRAEAMDVKALFDAVATKISDSGASFQEFSRPHEGILAATGVDLDAIVLPFLIRLLRSYSGVGQIAPMQGREHGFLDATYRWIAGEGRSSCPGGLKSLVTLCESQSNDNADALGAAVKCMETLGVPMRHWNDFVRRKFLALRGWSSLFAYLERFAENPKARAAPKYRLIDFLAVYLTVTVAAVKDVTPNPSGWKFMKTREEKMSWMRLVAIADTFDAAQVTGLSSADIQSLSDADFGQFRKEIAAFGDNERRRVLHLAYERGHLLKIFGSLAPAQPMPRSGDAELIARIVFCADDKASAVRTALEKECSQLRTYGVPSLFGARFGGKTGFTIRDKVAAISRLCALIGIDAQSPSLVIIAGHASVPEDRASDWTAHCGVCNGDCDVAHARTLADWANDSAVRDGLRLRGIDLPANTWFLAARHSPPECAFEILDSEKSPEHYSSTLIRIRALLARACSSSVQQQSRWSVAGRMLKKWVARLDASFTTANPTATTGHPGCAIGLIGFDGRSTVLPGPGAFLASYASAADADGRILAALLEELIPACAKINLDYFFARVDNSQYGVGHEHSRDSSGDLRAGLPWSAVEAHDPLRLMVIVQAPPVILEQALRSSPHSSALVKRQWVRLASLHEHVIHRVGEYKATSRHLSAKLADSISAGNQPSLP